ncbi:N-acetylglucosamine kinase [Alkalihalobacillus sp. AL-G]|uniref:N-acetylglucosamine kinase n=1 Tax=Alkalihalobacillus sp. AL-G TaxID=2926399 RepID=UPI00272BF911|nr:BadF/BadG/BcrA/BcrD ATPase family protein [Alkalihalobacillus sp. AL-G]WLD91937.1 hypothetical protein MOJ78_12925 [Alkalihalobacillus sp. AL-G]
MGYIGIDGGGTKTTIALVDERGSFIARYDGGPGNPLSTGIEEVEDTLISLIDKVRSNHTEAFSRVKSVLAGMAGTENKHARTKVLNVLQSQFPSTVDVDVTNDALTALYSGTGGAPGIVNIAGTGSITYGITREGKEVRIGGWGYLTDHHGSGYGVGRLAIRKMFEAYDGLSKNTSIEKRILERFPIKTPPELVPFLYDSANLRTQIASICEDVFDEWMAGDEVASEIIQIAGKDISRCIVGMLHQYFHNEKEVKVVLTGSVFKRLDRFKPLIETNLPEDTIIIVPKLPPVAGAVIAGYQKSRMNHSNEFIETLKRTYR